MTIHNISYLFLLNQFRRVYSKAVPQSCEQSKSLIRTYFQESWLSFGQQKSCRTLWVSSVVGSVWSHFLWCWVTLAHVTMGRVWYVQYHLKGVPSMPSSGKGLGHKQGITVTKNMSSGFKLLRSDLASPFIVVCLWTNNLCAAAFPICKVHINAAVSSCASYED